MDRYIAARGILRAIANTGGIREAIDKCALNNAHIIFYGASELADILIKLCEKEKIRIDGLCDRIVCSDGWDYLGVPLISIDTLKDMSDVTVIITALGFEKQIKDDLRQIGINNIKSVREIFRQ